jgi:uncharacterized protein (DUF1697 family)
VYTYIALLRGINVGGNNLLPMKELVSILESLGYEDVQTYIQSGNVVLRSHEELEETHAAQISKEILANKGFEPHILLISAPQFQEIIDKSPYATDVGKTLHLYFTASQPENPDLERMESLRGENEEYSLGDHVFYLYAPDGIGRSKLATIVEPALGVAATARNWNTVRKLADMAASART